MAPRRPRQLQLPVPPTWGGRRPGAGRKPTSARPGRAHAPRPEHNPRHPVHVTLRGVPALASFRAEKVFPYLQRALAASSDDSFRVLHFSVQSDHLHLIVEADGTGACPRHSGPRRALRPGCQSRARTARHGVGAALSRSSPALATRGAPGSGLRAAQLSQAPARRAGDRPAQLGSMVRRLGEPRAARPPPPAPSVLRAPGSLRSAGAAAAASSTAAKRPPA